MKGSEEGGPDVLVVCLHVWPCFCAGGPSNVYDGARVRDAVEKYPRYPVRFGRFLRIRGENGFSRVTQCLHCTQMVLEDVAVVPAYKAVRGGGVFSFCDVVGQDGFRVVLFVVEGKIEVGVHWVLGIEDSCLEVGNRGGSLDSFGYVARKLPTVGGFGDDFAFTKESVSRKTLLPHLVGVGSCSASRAPPVAGFGVVVLYARMVGSVMGAVITGFRVMRGHKAGAVWARCGVYIVGCKCFSTPRDANAFVGVFPLGGGPGGTRFGTSTTTRAFSPQGFRVVGR